MASLLFSLLTIAQVHDKYQQQALLLKRVIQLNHYQPRPIDDTFSIMLFDTS
ncbi:MAG: hypothetical protein H0X41_10190 [Chitinophagaceae bacterium]|nr:hypothetical protein [Chitinophagaceae bacterium]